MSNGHQFAAGGATGLQLLAFLKAVRFDFWAFPWILARLGF